MESEAQVNLETALREYEHALRSDIESSGGQRAWITAQRAELAKVILRPLQEWQPKSQNSNRSDLEAILGLAVDVREARKEERERCIKATCHVCREHGEPKRLQYGVYIHEDGGGGACYASNIRRMYDKREGEE